MPSFATHPPIEKKKKRYLLKVIKAPTPTPASPSTSTPFALDSSAHASEGVSSLSRLDPSDPGTYPSKPKPESIALGVINEPEEEEEYMSNNLRIGFKERHRKRLHEAIDMVPSPSQKSLPEKGSGRTREEGSFNASAPAGCYGA